MVSKGVSGSGKDGWISNHDQQVRSAPKGECGNGSRKNKKWQS